MFVCQCMCVMQREGAFNGTFHVMQVDSFVYCAYIWCVHIGRFNHVPANFREAVLQISVNFSFV